MKRLIQPNRWSCTITSLAMILDESVENLIKDIGYDGSEIIFPDAPEPTNRKGFIFEDLLLACWPRGYTLTQIDRTVHMQNVYTGEERFIENVNFSDKYKGHIGILGGKTPLGRGHAVAFDGTNIIDPRDGFIQDPTDCKINWITFFRLFTIKSM